MPIILLVDDDQLVRDIYSLRLRGLGYTTAGAGDAETGLELVRRLRPALVLLDLRMPHVSGAGFLRALRSDPDVSATPVVLVTTTSEPEHLAPLVDLGIQGHLVKGNFSITELFERVRALAGPAEPSRAA